MDDTLQDKLDAAVLRRLLDHLRLRDDAQNIDLMGLAGFCRNCLSEWYGEAAAEHGAAMSKDEARHHIYGMSYEDYKQRHQRPATPEQLARMEASVALNKAKRSA